MNSWLPITEYAVRNRVSVSTIRRKIKNNEIQYKLDGGKYFILNDQEQPLKEDVSDYSSVDEVFTAASRAIKEILRINSGTSGNGEEIINMQKKRIHELQEELTELKMIIKLMEKEKGMDH